MPVYLLGAGPGDPGLLTIRGAEVLRTAEVVVYDRLAQGVLALAPPEAEKIYVGKTPNGPRYPQEDINALLVKLAKKHKVVVRLKGGDPFVFARGGEEAEALLSAGVDFEIIPGIASPIAVPAYAGIPITLRHSSTSFTVITGHEDPSTEESINWSAAVSLGGTLIILMGAARWGEIAEQLLKADMPPDTPATAVRWGTRPTQTTIRATLGTLGDHTLQPPVTIVVGKVAEKDLSWYEKLPLFGKKVLITRPIVKDPPAQTQTLAGALLRVGAQPVEVPLIEIAPPSDKGAGVLQGLDELSAGDWVVCTSANGVYNLFSFVEDARALGGFKVAAIGPATAEAFRSANIEPDLIPPEFVAESLLSVFPTPTSTSSTKTSSASKPKVLIARAAQARETLPEGLAQMGYEVLVREAYQTLPAEVSDEDIAAINEVDIATFASPSAVRRFAELGLPRPKIIACIGPITAAAAEAEGLTPDIVATTYTAEGLVSALKENLT